VMFFIIKKKLKIKFLFPKIKKMKESLNIFLK